MSKNRNLVNTLHPNAIKGILLFNQMKFFEAHEELEFAWRAEPGPIRDLYRGILQIGVAYYHLTHRNFSGAQKLLGRAMKWLKPYSGFYLGINIGKLKKDAMTISKKITDGDFDHVDSIETDLFALIEFQIQKEK